MQVFRKLDDVPADFGPTVLSVGNFDGVHLAHQSVLRNVVERATQLSARSLAVTFEPHPTRILRPDVAPLVLTPLPIKLKLLEATGLDAVLVLPFTRDLSVTPPRDFAGQILASRLHAREVHEGSNFHFGHRAEGNVTRLAEFGRDFGFELQVYQEMRVRGDVVSSSRIRELLLAGRVSRAARLLGRNFSIMAPPGRGRGFGHKFTVPTINLSRYDEMVPQDGVYITCTRLHALQSAPDLPEAGHASDETFESVTNVGNRPTFGADSFAIESHLLNFHPIEITADTQVEITFLHRLRVEIKFPNVEALREQIARDVKRAQSYFRLREATRHKS